MKKICLVTGGTGGIGSAISRKMNAAGYLVIATCRPEKVDLIDAIYKSLFDGLKDIYIYPVDVACFESCAALVSKIKDDFGPVSVLINNAGITDDSTLKKMDIGQWKSVLATNLDSVFNMSQLVFSSMCDQGWGRVVNIASINAQKGQFGQVNYASAKSGMLGFTKSLAAEGARYGVTVNSVSPGYIATSMVTDLPQHIVETIVSQIPVGRLGTADEVAQAVGFLVGDDSGFITGSNLAVNGGQHMF